MNNDSNPDSHALARAILNTLAYADVFDYPLTAGQIQRYLSGLRASLETVSAELASLSGDRVVCQTGPYYLLPGRESCIQRRAARERQAALLWPSALSYGRVIAGLPFVRMLAVTGSLAVNNTDAGGDIDYLIVTVPGHLWFCRLMVLAVVRLAAWRGFSLCPNYLISENALEIPEHNLYTAHEFAQMVPLCGLELYQRMCVLNPWVKDFLPNVDGFEDGSVTGNGFGLPPLTGAARMVPPAGRPLLERILTTVPGRLRPFLERVLATTPGVWLENWEMARKIRKLSRENAGNPETVFSADLCKGHSQRHGQRTAASLAERLNRLALETRQ